MVETRANPAAETNPPCGSAVDAWPDSPVAGNARLVPITSWHAMWEEVAVTGVDFDDFWLTGVEKGVVYFFRWLGEPRATVLAVWSGDELHSVECRGRGDRQLSAAESAEIVGEVHQAFAEAGISLVAHGFA